MERFASRCKVKGLLLSERPAGVQSIEPIANIDKCKGVALLMTNAHQLQSLHWSEGRMRNLAAGALLSAAALVLPAAAPARSGYPERPIRMIVTFAPGGPTDVIARIIAQKAGEHWAQQIVVENIAGGGGNIGMANAARAPADGYTVVVVSTGFMINPSLYARAPYYTKDFTPISLVASSPDVLTVHPDVPAKSVGELVALIKASPGHYSYAQPGIGSTAHLAAELFKLKTGVDIVMVPFGGAGGRATNATMGGHTPIGFTALPPAIPSIKEGRLRGLAVLAAERNEEVPDVATMAEAGISDLESYTLTGLVAAAGTPKAIVDVWHREVARILALPDVKTRLKGLGFTPAGTSPEEYAHRIDTEAAKWRKVIRDTKLRFE
jgi:tripartite-type tricarboxylate transporter receptor subunit TctC